MLLKSEKSLGLKAIKASGKKIINEKGDEVILRGMGLGGWMLQEPYMMEMGGFAGTQWQIDLLGFAAEWGKDTSSAANFKGSGTVDETDLSALLNQLK